MYILCNVYTKEINSLLNIPWMVSELLVLYRVILSFIYLIFSSMSDASSTSFQTTTTSPDVTNLGGCISIDASAKLPLKLTPDSYLTWRAQFISFAFGYDLLEYIDGTLSCPSPTRATKFGTSSSTPSTPKSKPCMPSPDATRSPPLSFHYSLDFWKKSHLFWDKFTTFYANCVLSCSITIFTTLSLLPVTKYHRHTQV